MDGCLDASGHRRREEKVNILQMLGLLSQSSALLNSIGGEFGIKLICVPETSSDTGVFVVNDKLIAQKRHR